MPLTVTTQTLIKQDLMRHEGVVKEVYLDHLGNPTSGIGHLEFKKEVGEEVTLDYIFRNFNEDFSDAVFAAHQEIDLTSHPENVQRVVVNMVFNLGATGFKRFDKMIAALHRKDYDKAADEMINSKWYNQVGRRSEFLVQLMRNS